MELWSVSILTATFDCIGKKNAVKSPSIDCTPLSPPKWTKVILLERNPFFSEKKKAFSLAKSIERFPFNPPERVVAVYSPPMEGAGRRRAHSGILGSNGHECDCPRRLVCSDRCIIWLLSVCVRPPPPTKWSWASFASSSGAECSPRFVELKFNRAHVRAALQSRNARTIYWLAHLLIHCIKHLSALILLFFFFLVWIR